MNSDPLLVDTYVLRQRLETFAARARGLPADAVRLVDEILASYAFAVENLQVVAEEMYEQNEALQAARQEAEMQRQRYQNLFEFAPDGYLVTDLAGIVLDANRSAQKMLDASKAEVVGRPLVLYVRRSERERFHRNLNRLRAPFHTEPDAIEWEAYFQSAKGNPFPVIVTVAPAGGLPDETPSALRWQLRDISILKRTQKQERQLAKARHQRLMMEETNRQWRDLIEMMPIGLIVSDKVGNLMITNTAARGILGVALAEPVGAMQLPYMMYYPDGTPLLPQDTPLARVLESGRILRDTEIILRHIDGEEHILLASAGPIVNAADEIVMGVMVFQDITERKRAGQALLEYADRLKILHETDQAILSAGAMEDVLDPSLRFLYRLLHCTRAGVLLFDFENQVASLLAVYTESGTRLEKGWRGPLDDSWVGILEKLAQGEICIAGTTNPGPALMADVLHAEGVRTRVYLPLIIEGKLIGSLNLGLGTAACLNAEQTEVAREFADQLAVAIQQDRLRQQLRQHAQYLEEKVARRTMALQNSMAQFQAIFESAAIGIAVLDEGGCILNSNPALQRILGYDADALAGKRVFDLLDSPEEREEALRLFARLFSGDLNYFRNEVSYRRQDGQLVTTARTMSLVRSPKGTPARAIAMVEDIGEQKKAQMALIQSEKLILMGRMSASFAHEINNPLQSVIGCLGLAEEMVDDRSRVNRYLQLAMEELERAASIVHQLRDMGRTPDNVKKVPIDLNALIEDILLLMHKRCQNERVEVVWKPASNLPRIPIMAERIHQVFLNLLLNALEAMQGGGRLEVSTCPQASGVCTTFTDSGVGIAPQELEHIFEPFHSTRSDGLGLGLYVSKAIVDEHHGTIYVESRPGQGTSFTVCLPG
ncbi:MAG: PAS domain S-box protein [Chloroflexota bacterium]